MTARTFKLIRDEDVSNVSGTGTICEGVLFSDGHAAIHWLGRMPLTTPYPCLEWVLEIQGHGGKTRLVWDDEAEPRDFSEEDIALLHDILALPETGINIHGRARQLLKTIRANMAKIPRQNSIP